MTRRLPPFLFIALLLVTNRVWAAGNIEFVEGNVSIANDKGEIHMAKRGERVENGDVLTTGRDSELHVRTDDSGYLALRANTQLKVQSYVANGDDKDNVVLKLLRGTFRSITGWIGKEHPDKYVVATSTATIGIRGTDHEPMVITEGADAGTYDKVNTGTTVLNTQFGRIEIQPKQVGFVPRAGTHSPELLATTPAAYRPSPHEDTINKAREEVEKSAADLLKARRLENQRKSSEKTASPKVSTAQDVNRARAALDEMLRAYERGDTLALGNRLNPAMIGYQKVLDDMTRELNQCKQVRINLRDTQIQAGPDLAIVQTGWEKRCLQLPNFTPRYLSGQSTFLMHRANNGWSLAALAGSSPFVVAAAVSTPSITVSYPGWTCIRVIPGAAGISLPFSIVVQDGNKAGLASVTARITSGNGENEPITLAASGTGGQFSVSSVVFQQVSPVPDLTVADGKVYVGNGIGGCQPAALNITVTYSYTDNGVTKSVSASQTIAP